MVRVGTTATGFETKDEKIHRSRSDWRGRPPAPAHPRFGVQGFYRRRLRGHQHARHRDASQGFETRSLCEFRQQACDARRLHRKPRRSDADAFGPARAAQPRRLWHRPLPRLRRTSCARAVIRRSSQRFGWRSRKRRAPRKSPRRSIRQAARRRAARSSGYSRTRNRPGSSAPEEPAEMAAQYLGLLWESMMVSLLLGIAAAPKPSEAEHRAAKATAAFMQLHEPRDTDQISRRS